MSSRRPRVETKKASSAPLTSCGRPRRGRDAAGTAASSPSGTTRSLLALAADADGLLLEVDVDEVEVDRLAAAQAGRVDELEQRAVAERERIVARVLLEHGVDLGGLGRVGQPARAPRPELSVRDASGTEGEPEQGAHRGQLARDRRRRELARIAARTGGAELGGVRAQRRGVDVLERLPALPKPGRELLDVDAVGAAGRLGALGRVEEALDEGAVRHPDGFALLARWPANAPSRRSRRRGSGTS